MSEEEKCSFCDKPGLSVLHLFVGPGGCNVCDECVQRALASEPFAFAGIKCCFCGKNSPEVPILMTSGQWAVCRYCVDNCAEQISDVMPGQSEFLSSEEPAGSNTAAMEFVELLERFLENFEIFITRYHEGNMDWPSHNEMAKLPPAMRSKAALFGEESMTDVLWRMEQLLGEIQLDDVEANRKAVEELEALVTGLVEPFDEE